MNESFIYYYYQTILPERAGRETKMKTENKKENKITGTYSLLDCSVVVYCMGKPLSDYSANDAKKIKALIDAADLIAKGFELCRVA